jgi:hypothetical protein
MSWGVLRSNQDEPNVSIISMRAFSVSVFSILSVNIVSAASIMNDNCTNIDILNCLFVLNLHSKFVRLVIVGIST